MFSLVVTTIPLLVIQESKALALYHKALAFQKAGDVPHAEELYSDVLKTDLLIQVCPLISIGDKDCNIYEKK